MLCVVGYKTERRKNPQETINEQNKTKILNKNGKQNTNTDY